MKPFEELDALTVIAVKDPPSGEYTAYFRDFGGLIVEGSKEEIHEKLRDLMIDYLKHHKGIPFKTIYYDPEDPKNDTDLLH